MSAGVVGYMTLKLMWACRWFLCDPCSMVMLDGDETLGAATHIVEGQQTKGCV